MPAAEGRPGARSLRPAFVWALAIIVVPMLILFGLGFVNDVRSPWRLVAAPAYAVGAFAAPFVFVRRTLRIGLRGTNALAGGLAIASAVLFADLVLFLGAGEGSIGAALVVAVTGGAMALALQWQPGTPPPPATGWVPPRSDR